MPEYVDINSINMSFTHVSKHESPGPQSWFSVWIFRVVRVISPFFEGGIRKSKQPSLPNVVHPHEIPHRRRSRGCGQHIHSRAEETIAKAISVLEGINQRIHLHTLSDPHLLEMQWKKNLRLRQSCRNQWQFDRIHGNSIQYHLHGVQVHLISAVHH